MGFRKYKWHRVAASAAELSWSPGDIALVEVDGKKVCIARFADGWYGFSHSCPHAGGLMNEGYLDDAGNVVCPIHHYKFSLRNGRNTTGEGYKLKTYPVELRPEGVFVGIEEGLFGWL
ncbi:MAG: Rieske 2Fe-2S domain-containing protein [Bacteroidota bacterium]|nr:Rieske 2Fe-2S domain-containing protein [Bacteroidota bacterium]MDP4255815.1 Rieske 2Fe-2S domain-containing protein [Bacteroidota bacterium]MDP4258982.1 Rieske 2Fe-2S domain-containing protein [Bacteroidota bacterium]